MPIRVERGQQVRLMGKSIEISDGGAPVGEGTQRVDGDAGSMKDMFRAGDLATLYRLGVELPAQAIGHAINVRMVNVLGIHPSVERGYDPKLQKNDIVRVDERAKSELVWDRLTGKTVIAQEPTIDMNSFGKKVVDRRNKQAVQKVYQEIRKRMLVDAQNASTFAAKVETELTTSKAQQADPGFCERKAFAMMGDGSVEAAKGAFYAGQGMTEMIKEATEDERLLATRCLEVERASKRVWSEQERKVWVMGHLGRQSLGIVIDTGRALAQIEELRRLEILDLRKEARENQGVDEVVLLKVPTADVALAKRLGVEGESPDMILGATIILTRSGVVMETLAGRSKIVNETADLDVDAALTPGAGLVARVRKGNFGPKVLKKAVDWILGQKPNDVLPLPGNLSIGSTQKQGEATPIPMLNPLLASKTLETVRDAMMHLDDEVADIKAKNGYADIHREDLSARATESTLTQIRTLPNAQRVVKMVEKKRAVPDQVMRSPGADAVRGFLQIDITPEHARQIIFVRNAEMRTILLTAHPDQGAELIVAIEDRALKVLIPDRKAAVKYIARGGRAEMYTKLKKSNPDTADEMLARLDAIGKAHFVNKT